MDTDHLENKSHQNQSARTVLANPNFRRLWIGQAISNTGDALTNLAILIVINRLTGSSAALGVMMVVVALPQLLFGLLSGVYVDRWDRRRTMIVSDVLRGLLVLGFLLVRRPEDVWIFYVLGFLQAAVGTFFTPAKNALLPSILEGEALLAANALSQTTQVVAGVVGAGLAGVLVGAAGNGWPAFTLDAASFFISALFIRRITTRHTPGLAAGGWRQTLAQLGDGLGFLVRRRLLVGVMVTFAVTMLGLGAVNVLFVPFLVDDLQVPTQALGVVEAGQVLGMVLGSALVAALARRVQAVPIIVGGVVGVGAFVALIGAAPGLAWVLGGLFFVGLCLTPVQASAATLYQTHIPDEKRGRAGSAMSTVITTASLISMGLAGLLGEALGVRQVFFLSGGITIFAGLLALVLMRPQAIRELHEKASTQGR
jgi:MFS family permease